MAPERADAAEAVTDEELAEFLAADFLPEAADPEFRARLRERLLVMVRAGTGPVAAGEPESD